MKKKMYAFASNARDWNAFLDNFTAEIGRYRELDHIHWSSTYTGGVGKLTVDYGEREREELVRKGFRRIRAVGGPNELEGWW